MASPTQLPATPKHSVIDHPLDPHPSNELPVGPFSPTNLLELLLGAKTKPGFPTLETPEVEGRIKPGINQTAVEPQVGIYEGPGGPLVVKTIRGDIKAQEGDTIVAVPDPLDETKYLGLYVIPAEMAVPPDPPVLEDTRKPSDSPSLRKT